MRIVIDMQGAQAESRFRGIGRYTMSLVSAMAKNRGHHEIILALNKLFPETLEGIRRTFEPWIPTENIRVWYTPGPTAEVEATNLPRGRIAEVIREAFLESLNPDIILVTSLFEGLGDNAVTSVGRMSRCSATAAIIYDLIPLLSPDEHFKNSRIHQEFYARKIDSIKRCSLLLAISESARQEALRGLNFDKNKVINISGACDASFRRLELNEADRDALYSRIGVSRPFVMYTGGADDRKNLHRLICSYADMPLSVRSSHQLVLAGKMPEAMVDSFLETARKSGLKKDEVVFTGYVDDGDLIGLYNTCRAFIFPSLHEGFGLPPLEAMACGAPVIGANATSLPEVIGLEEAMFNPLSGKEITAKLMDVLTDEDFRQRLIEFGAARVKEFSWDQSACKALKALESLHRSNRKSKRRKPDDLLSEAVSAIAGCAGPEVSDLDIVRAAHGLTRVAVRPCRRQLLIDVSELSQRDSKTGVQRVTKSILREIFKNPPEGFDVRPVYGTTDVPGYRYARRFCADFLRAGDAAPDEPVDFNPGDVFLGLDLQHHVVIAQQDYLSSLRQDGVRIYFVIHDLLPITHPDYFPDGLTLAHEEWLTALARFDGVVCVSRTTADEYASWLSARGIRWREEFNIGWSHNGADMRSSGITYGLPDDAASVLNALANAPSFLMVGTIEPRKGYDQVLDAFNILWKAGSSAVLVLVGQRGWKTEDLIQRIDSHSALGKQLFWLEGVSDEYLEKVYAAATCLIAAAKGEGFGLPVIEAAQHKLPIIARDIPVFREVAGDHAFYFSGIEPQNLSAAINNWLALEAEGKAPQSADMPWLTWKQSAKQLMDIVLGLSSD